MATAPKTTAKTPSGSPTQAARDESEQAGSAMKGGRFPINNKEDLRRAIQAVGRAKGGEAGRQAVRRFIIKRARALGLTDMIPSNWASNGALKSGS